MRNGVECLAIVNPVSGGGSTARHWSRIHDELSRHVRFRAVFTRRPGHAIELGRAAREAGFPLVVCVGGDGTLNEVVNGLMQAGTTNPMPAVGIVPCGTGSDFVRSLGVPRRLEEACRRLAAPESVSCDLGVISFDGGGAAPSRRYFVNAAGLGFDGEVVKRCNGLSRFARGTIPYLASLAATLLTYQRREVVLTLDSVLHRRRITSVVVALGSYFGGGMRIAPNALLHDGLFDVITVGDVGRLELVRNVPGLYSGAHLFHPAVLEERAVRARVESDQQVLVQADGELLGRLPADFQLLPGAISFVR